MFRKALVMRIRALIILAITAALSLVLWAMPAYAQDPAVVNSKTIRVRFENDRVRVLEAILPPGVKEQVHSHPAYVIYVLAGVGIATTQQMARSRRARSKRATLSIATL